MHVDGTINQAADRDRGWTVEIAFPWKALAGYAHRRTPPGEGDQWRVDFSRVEWQVSIVDGRYAKVPNTREDNWVWSPQGIIDMHRPEKWGFVQFSRKPFGESKFTPDPGMAARDALQEVYYAERDFEAKNHRWTASSKELGLPGNADKDRAGSPVIRLTKDGFEAVVEIKTPEGRSTRWRIRQDARVWAE